MLSRATFPFVVWVNDGIDSVQITGVARKVFVNRYDYLNTENEVSIPSEFALHPNYPNPFNPITTIKFDLPEKSQVKIFIYDIQGRGVRQLVNRTEDTGYKSIQWDATDNHGRPVSAGVYLYQIHAGDFIQVRKMVLMK
ncbi:T9SS type A sorting domain-containing protein [Caldithrix abyssi]|nr:T9SS type A sorting domain-containing protein [Caldithrix abyssi]